MLSSRIERFHRKAALSEPNRLVALRTYKIYRINPHRVDAAIIEHIA
jgi:hypothetical protein